MSWKQQSGFGVQSIERPELAMLAVQGPEARAKVADLLPGHTEAINSLGLFMATPAKVYGVDWLVARTGYTGEEKEQAGTTLYENTAFPGGWISMAPPLEDDLVEYADGHSADMHHMSQDVAAFLMWTAEPKMMARKRAGFVAVLFLGVLAVMLYYTNRKLWAPVKRKEA